MKNKLISAMLVGMSASMAFSGTAVFAENEPTATETEVTDESTTEEAEEVDISFLDKIPTLTFTNDIFGKDYGTQLTEYITTEDFSQYTTLYDVEKDIADKMAEIMKDENEDIIKAAKYKVATIFEKTYGDDAIEYAKEIRNDIVTMENPDTYTTISALQEGYKALGGTESIPADLIKEEEKVGEEAAAEIAETAEEATEENTEGATEKTEAAESTESAEPQTTEKTTDNSAIIEDTTVTDASAETVTPLVEYCEGIADLETQEGVELIAPTLTWDDSHVSNVSVDLSTVDISTRGVYDIVYSITGVDGLIDNVTRTCTVTENSELTELRTSMNAAVDEISAAKDITESDYVSEWTQAATEAKSKINTAKTQEEMQAIIDEATAKAEEIKAAQQLTVAQAGYVNVLNDAYENLSLDTEVQTTQAKEIVTTATEEIQAAETIDAAATVLSDAQSELMAVANDDESSLETSKQTTIETLKTLKDLIKDKTTITDNVYNALVAKINSCTTSEELDSVTHTGGLVFTDCETIVNDNTKLSTFVSLFTNLKGAAVDSDTTAVIAAIANLGTPSNLETGESRVQDATNAITLSASDFKAYLAKKLGKDVSGDTKADMYTNYATNGGAAITSTPTKEVTPSPTTAPTDNLSQQKTKAKADIKAVVDKQTDENIKAAVSTLADYAYKKIDKATTKDEITEVTDAFNQAIEVILDNSDDNTETTLTAARADAYVKLDKLLSNANSDYVSETMKSDIAAAQSKVLKAETAEECTQIYADAKVAFDSAYLSAMKASYADKLDALLTLYTFANDTDRTSAAEIIAKQKVNIEAATSESAMESCYKLAKTSIESIVNTSNNETDLSAKKIEAIAKINSVVSNPSTEGKNIIAKYTTKINAATSEADISQLVTDCITELTKAEEQVNTDKTKEALAEAKAKAIQELKNAMSSSPSTVETSTYQSYVDKINAATSEDEVKTLLSTGKEALSTAQQQTVTTVSPTAAATVTPSTTAAASETDALETAKKEAKESLQNMLATVPSANKEAATAVYNSYVEKINAATTTSEVEELKNEAISQLKKYGGDENAAKPNSSTSTTLGNSDKVGESATDKIGESGAAGTAGTVKTGDENGTTMAIAGSAFLAAIATAVMTLKKFKKKD